MQLTGFKFGSIQIDGVVYEYDVVIDRGKVAKRKKKASKRYRAMYDHTPLSLAENIPWKCRRLLVGTGAHGGMPVMAEVREEAEHRGVKLETLPTKEAIRALAKDREKTNGPTRNLLGSFGKRSRVDDSAPLYQHKPVAGR